MTYKATGNLRAIQILLGHTKIENTVRYLGVDIEHALLLAERTEIRTWAVIRSHGMIASRGWFFVRRIRFGVGRGPAEFK